MIPADKIIDSLTAQDFIDKDMKFFKELADERKSQINEGFR